MDVNELITKYGNWGSHPRFDVDSWVSEVAAGDTRRGYWDWVLSEMEIHEEELVYEEI